MRLLLINPNTNAATTAAMLAIAREAAPEGCAVEAMTAGFGASLITDEAALATAAEAVLSLEPDIERRSPQGVIVGAFGDPGLEALRDLVPCPVTGLAEAGMAAAARGGRRFAVVTTTLGLAEHIRRSVEAYGHAAACVGVRVTPGEPSELMAKPARLEAALAAACAEAIRRDLAEALVIGGGPLAVAARALAPRFAVPIVEPLPEAVRLAVERAAHNAAK
jgi:Asp/Glu/hydantoin racemase